MISQAFQIPSCTTKGEPNKRPQDGRSAGWFAIAKAIAKGGAPELQDVHTRISAKRDQLSKLRDVVRNEPSAGRQRGVTVRNDMKTLDLSTHTKPWERAAP